MDRKQFIKWAGTLGGVFTLGGLLARKEEDKSEICSTPYSSSYSPPPVNVRTNHVYGSMFEPPINIGEKYSSQFYFPKNKKIEYIEESFDLNLIPFKIQIAHSVNYDAWTFNGTVPGPIIRTKQGKELQFKFTNSSTEPHSLHFHGSHSPQEDGWEGVPSFGKKTYKIKPLLHGIYPYHCHVPPIAIHISKGLYGTMIVDPPGGREAAHEFVLVFSNWFLERNIRLYTWNGIANLYERYPMKVPVGEKVRFYIINMLEGESGFTFHMHSTTFDIIRSMGKTKPEVHSDVVTLGPTDRAILEFTLPERGRYMFHPHETHMAENGGMGWIVAI